MCERQKCNSLHMNTFHTMSPIRYLRHRTHGADGRNRCDWSNRCHRRDGCYGYRRDGRHRSHGSNGYRRDGRHRSHGRNGCNRCDWSNRRHRAGYIRET